MNGDFMVSQASKLAALARQAYPLATERRLDLVWRRTLGRSPTADEVAKALPTLKDEASLDRLCLVLLNTNEFLYVD